MKLHSVPIRSSRESGYTLFEIMLVLGIIAVLVGSAIYLLAGNIDIAKEQRVETDLQTIGTQLKTYEMRNYTFPSTDQGLEALVRKPTGEPAPRRWSKLLEDVPVDPWGQPYIYRYPGKGGAAGFDLYSMGADRQDGTDDDFPKVE
ncbi:MAG: type II secretion system major pseudopilin GspG [Chthoniobacterales bacterium]